jgi:uncharacterized protein with FMN-binding domain
MRPRAALAASTMAGFAAVLALHMASPPAHLALGGSPTTTVPSPTPTTTPSGSPRSAVGASEQFGYGAISLKVTARGSRIVSISVANLQTAESYSQSLADQVIPMLTSEALTAQSANIQGVSGASYTSQGFAQSLQSALTQLGL